MAESDLLDGLDRQLVRALQLDPRASFSRIAATLAVSEQTVARRYRRLRGDGLLRVIGAVDPRALGLADWMIRVHCRPDAAWVVADGLARREDVSWVTINAGGSEVAFALRARTDAEREDLLVRRLPKSASVLSVTAAVLLHRYVGTDFGDRPHQRGGLAHDRVRRVSATRQVPATRTASLAEGDHALLDLLARDGRAGYVELAEATGKTVGHVVRRVNALRDDGVVYFDVDLAEAALGNPTTALIWLAVAPAHLQAAGAALAEHHEVPFAAAVSGPANLLVSVTCLDLPDLYRYITTRLARVKGVTGYELSPTTRRVKQAGAIVTGNRLADPTPTSRTRVARGRGDEPAVAVEPA